MSRLVKLLVAVPAALTLLLALTAPGTAAADVDIYITPGKHTVNSRQWDTTCEPYSRIRRCRTNILATQVSQVGGRFVARTDWVFNNLTYTAGPRTLWKSNPLGANGVVGGKVSWTADDGRKWRTECDTENTGRNGCRSWIVARVIESYKTSGGATAYRWVSKEIFNNMVRFTTSSTPTTPTTPPTTPPRANVVEPYVLKGRVLDPQGRPLAGATVGADDTMLSYGDRTTRTDANGYFRISLANTSTTWRSWGATTVVYHGRTYHIDLHNDPTGFSSRSGAVRNMQWKLVGPRPQSDDEFHGGAASFHESWDSPQPIEDWSRVRATFTPVGPLIDGSTGEVIVRTLTTDLQENLPIGRYRITATYTRPGTTTPVPLRLKDFRDDDAPYANSLDVVLPPWDVDGGKVTIDLLLDA